MRNFKSHIHQIPRQVFSYKDKWIALSENGKKILAAGKVLETVLKKAERLGFKNPVLIKAPKEWGLYILHAIPISKNSRQRDK